MEEEKPVTLVSIHAPYAGSDVELSAVPVVDYSVSIHAPYAGSDTHIRERA